MSTEAVPPISAPPPAIPVPPTPPPTFTTWDKGDGTLDSGYYEKLPDDVKYMKDTLSKYKTRDELVRGFANATTLAGKKGLIPLPENAPPEARADRKALLDGINGVPKEPKDYGLTRPAEIPEAGWNQKLVDGFQKWAWERSVSPAAVKELTTMQTEAIKEQIAFQQEGERKFWEDQQKSFESTVRVESSLGGLEKANALAERGAQALGFDLTRPEHQLILKNVTVRLAMARHALSVGEDSFIRGEADKGAGGDPLALASDAVHNRANPLYAPLHDPSHAQHKEVKARVDNWWRAASAKKK